MVINEDIEFKIKGSNMKDPFDMNVDQNDFDEHDEFDECITLARKPSDLYSVYSPQMPGK